MKRILISLMGLLVLLPLQARAEVSGEIALLSDYRYNGVSYSNRGVAVQGGLNYQHESGFYASTWASNLNFGRGDPADVEWDFFAGYFTALNADLGLDIGVAYYTYWGDTGADDYNFAEIYAGLHIQENTTLYVNYAPDYFGSDTHHYIVKVTHSIPVGDYIIGLAAAHNQSGDRYKYAWGETDDAYQYVEVSGARDWEGFNFKAALMATTIDDGPWESNAEPTIVVGVSRAFNL